MIHGVRWTAQKITQRIQLLEPLVYRRRELLPPFRYATLPDPMSTPLVGLGVDDSRWSVIEPQTYWGQWRTDFMLRSHFRIPGNWDPASPVGLYLPLGNVNDFSHPEALAYIDGMPYATCDHHHQEILLPDRWRDGQSHLLALHGWTGIGGWPGPEPGSRLLMQPCVVVQMDQPTRDFLVTARVALGVANSLAEESPARDRLLTALDEAFSLLDLREPLDEAFYESIGPAHALLRQGIAAAGEPLDVDVIAAGHSHVDVAWLWTLGQTRRKSGRTFHTVLRLMEQYPDYRYTQSQAQVYDYVRQDYPDLFQGIQKRVADGRWEAIGGMWVEADCNITGSESLARQFLLGRSFFREHFGAVAESPVLWLPDVFGYAWNLPQLIKEAGLEYFFTIKLSWNQYNRLPYDTFWWQGLDGTRVITHFSPLFTYNAMASPEQAHGIWRNYQQKELAAPLLMAYGYGDGGGGPTREMIENIREMAAFPGTPRLRQGSVGEFFREVEARAGDRLPVWNGELYFELHRGTYTTQSRNKRANRKSEFALHDAEFLATLAALLDSEYRYPAQTLRKAWEVVCLNQFHDIIPGSSIGPVYAESQQQYAQIQEMAQSVRTSALAVITNCLPGDLLVINPTSFARQDLAFWEGQLAPGQGLQRADEQATPCQMTDGGTWIAAGEVPPCGTTSLHLAQSANPSPDTGLIVSSCLLENQFLRVELNDAGDITRIYDKTNGREVLPAGAIANQFQAFEDRPLNWDAWDVDIFYDDKVWLAEPATSVRVTEAGPLRATLEVRRRILSSDTVQRISLAYNSPRLDFDTTMDWHERHILLKVAFPVDVFAPVATYEIQWGNVERPTHRNTSWDWARFETCAQKWVDLSEGNYGVSLLNDCKYGHDIRDNVLRISLLRGPTMPDPEADQGQHHFAYSLLPHAGRWNETTVAAAYALNDPLMVAKSANPRLAQGGQANGFSRLLSVDRPNIVIETVKWAEDGEGVIVRLYESQRQRGNVTLTAGFDIGSAWRANLLEENRASITPEGNYIRFSIRPYEIVTLRLVPRG